MEWELRDENVEKLLRYSNIRSQGIGVQVLVYSKIFFETPILFMITLVIVNFTLNVSLSRIYKLIRGSCGGQLRMGYATSNLLTDVDHPSSTSI